MITKFKIFENYVTNLIDKSNIIYKFKTKAITYNWQGRRENIYKYNVVIRQGSTEFPDDYGNLVLSVEDTPGSWFISTLMEYGSFYNNEIIIDGGSNWTIDNWQEISKEFFKILPDLEVMVQAKKYNL